MVYILILNWNGWKDTLACLDSVTRLVGTEFKVLICDNASTDASVEKINEWIARSGQDAGKYVMVQTGANLGFAGGNNVGLRIAMQDPAMKYCWLLNNDTEVDPLALSHMVDRMEANPTSGICGSRLVFFSDRSHMQALGGVYNSWLGTTGHYAEGEDASAVYSDDEVEQKIDYVVGASMLVSRRFLQSKGVMNESYFLYYEELDWAYAARPEFTCTVACKSVVYHKVGASISGTAQRSKTSEYYYLTNRLKFSRRFHPLRSPIVRLTYAYAALRRLMSRQYFGAALALKVMLSIPVSPPAGIPRIQPTPTPVGRTND